MDNKKEEARRKNNRGLPEVLEAEKEDCKQLRPLWEEVFAEDSKAFTDYYFREKAVRNHAFFLRELPNSGPADAMLYLSPYEMRIRTGDIFISVDINYIVGVATREKCRHKGYMNRLLNAALVYMHKKQLPFAFLMPADARIYKPYQFVYIYDREEYTIETSGLTKELEQKYEVSLHAAERREMPCMENIFKRPEKRDIAELARFAEGFMEKHKDVFIRRSENYFRTIFSELSVQGGGVYVRKKEPAEGVQTEIHCSNINGYLFYTEEGKPGIQEIEAEDTTEDIIMAADNRRVFSVKPKDRKTPVIMARIIHAQEMLSLLRTKEKEIKLNIFISDTILTENNGIWECRIGKDWSEIHKTAEKADCLLEIEKMASWIFAYKKTEECFTFTDTDKKNEVLYKLKKILLLEHVCINEIV